MVNRPPANRNRHSFQPLLFAAAQGAKTLPKAERQPANETRKPHPSHVRLRAPSGIPAATIEFLDAQAVLDEFVEEQLAFTMSLACLERAMESTPDDAATRTARRTLAGRVGDLLELRDALGELQHVSVEPRVQRLFVEDAPLSDYVRGLYAWVHAVVRALGHLAQGLSTRAVDWALYRWRIEEGKNFHFDELWEPIRADARSLGDEALDDALAGIFVAASILEQRLDHRFRG
jgi:hypothetical protein